MDNSTKTGFFVSVVLIVLCVFQANSTDVLDANESLNTTQFNECLKNRKESCSTKIADPTIRPDLKSCYTLFNKDIKTCWAYTCEIYSSLVACTKRYPTYESDYCAVIFSPIPQKCVITIHFNDIKVHSMLKGYFYTQLCPPTEECVNTQDVSTPQISSVTPSGLYDSSTSEMNEEESDDLSDLSIGFIVGGILFCLIFMVVISLWINKERIKKCLYKRKPTNPVVYFNNAQVPDFDPRDGSRISCNTIEERENDDNYNYIGDYDQIGNVNREGTNVYNIPEKALNINKNNFEDVKTDFTSADQDNEYSLAKTFEYNTFKNPDTTQSFNISSKNDSTKVECNSLSSADEYIEFDKEEETLKNNEYFVLEKESDEETENEKEIKIVLKSSLASSDENKIENSKTIEKDNFNMYFELEKEENRSNEQSGNNETENNIKTENENNNELKKTETNTTTRLEEAPKRVLKENVDLDKLEKVREELMGINASQSGNELKADDTNYFTEFSVSGTNTDLDQTESDSETDYQLAINV